MKFEIDQLDATKLHITAETKHEVVDIIKHFKLDLMTHAKFIGQDSFTYTEVAASNGNGQWYHELALVQPEFTKPYQQLVEKWTGYEGPWDLKLPCGTPYSDSPLGYTHYPLEIHLKADGVCHHKMILQSCDWNGRTGGARAQVRARDMAENWWGDRPHNPEYIHDSYGHIRKNPKYLQHESPVPKLTNNKVARTMFHWWLANVANERQKAHWAASDALNKKNTSTDTVDNLMRFDNVIRADWEKNFLTAEQFRDLK